MSSLVERLRIRTERKPLYNIDESDDEADLVVKGSKSASQSKAERFVRADAKDGSCQGCGESGDLLNCATCTYAYHSKCLLPPLKGPPPENWSCPECVSPLNDIDKILDFELRPTAADDGDASKLGSNQIFVKQYLVKWKGLSYLHCTWVPEKEFIKAYRANPRLRTKVNNFDRQKNSVIETGDEFVAVRPEWTTVDRILASRGDGDEKEYFVKYKELQYDECYWELESDISVYQDEIEKFKKIQSRCKSSSSKHKSIIRESKESKRKSKDFQRFEHSPDFLAGGSLHPYQLEGLNFLRYSWSKETHVILADEMGLGKTIQSIAFLASLFEENISPFLVVAPLSTLRNWEREFALWAPQMNVVMYVGSSQARSVIREYEFYFPKGEFKKHKKKKSGHVVSDSKQDRIKFDVLLTSYEMINLDSTSIKPIKWECMIVDEGHRLKNKDSKLFLSLKQYSSYHRVLLTGTPLQNNLDELFMLMHFLDAGKFASLEEFQEEFKDINQEEQVARLHKMLAPHLLRRVKKDVLKDMPPKKELILRVDLSSKQKEFYKAILTRNYEILTRRGGAQISLINVVMELRKLCCHAYMLEGVEPDLADADEAYRQLVDASGKLTLLDKMMVKLKEQGHRVLIYTQFQHMLDLLEDYCCYKKWLYERIDGKVSGAERQIRIDRFNAKNSSRFCFLLSTRAGGLGINLATADTVIIYDSDWNPHADLQAMARAHRLGQTNKVMIYRLITRGTIEERMMQMTKKKMVLEHLVVGKLKAQNINQVEFMTFRIQSLPFSVTAKETRVILKAVNLKEELDDIIRYGSKELFADDSDEAGKARQIHYDDAAIDRLLDREQAGEEEATVDDEEEDGGFLKAFKVANFEFIDEVGAAAEEEARKASSANKPTDSISESKRYWEELLRDRYEVHQIEETTALGKGKRSRKQMVSVDEDDLAGMEEVSSDGDSNEADWADAELVSSGAAPGRRPQKKKARVESMEPLPPTPLMEGEGKSFKVLGFNHQQRTAFVLTLMRFGVGDFDWRDFTNRVKQKTPEEIKEYGTLFISHIAEPITDSEFFSDGVPKEGIRPHDVLVRIAQLLLIRDKVKKLASEKPGTALFTEDVVSRYPGLRAGGSWKEEHDLKLLQGVLKHGYGKWQLIAEDKDLEIQQVICQQLNLPFMNGSSTGVLQTNPGTNTVNPEGISSDHLKDTAGSDVASGATATANQVQSTYQDPAHSYSFREWLRRLVEFIKKRVLLLEKGLNAEYQKEYFGEVKPHVTINGDHRSKMEAVNSHCSTSTEADVQVNENLPSIEPISPKEVSAVACDDKPDRLEMAQLYNEVCKVVTDNAQELDQTVSENRSATVRKNFLPLETVYEGIHRVLAPLDETTTTPEPSNIKPDQLTEPALEPTDKMDTPSKVTESALDPPPPVKTEAESSTIAEPTSSPKRTGDVEMVDADTDNAEVEQQTKKEDEAVIVLDD